MTDDTRKPAKLGRLVQRRPRTAEELFQLIRRHGFRAGSPNVISMWKHGKTPISLSTLPYHLKALGMSAPEMKLWSRCFLRAEHPDVMALIEEAA